LLLAFFQDEKDTASKGSVKQGFAGKWAHFKDFRSKLAISIPPLDDVPLPAKLKGEIVHEHRNNLPLGMRTLFVTRTKDYFSQVTRRVF
jgi:hypothetical protein